MAFLQTGVSMSSNFLDIYADEGGALVAVSIDGEAVPGTGPDQYAEPFSPIAAGDAHTCALGDLDPYYLRYTGVESRTVSCWGDNRHGQTNAPSLIIPSFTGPVEQAVVVDNLPGDLQPGAVGVLGCVRQHLSDFAETTRRRVQADLQRRVLR